MKTDELVAALARSASPANERAVSRRFAGMHLTAVLLCIATVAVFLGPRPDWREAVAGPMFWIKLAFPASVMVGAFLLLRRLGYPGMRTGKAPVAIAVPFGAVWAMALLVLAGAPSSERLHLLAGTSALRCVLVIAAVAVPALVVTLRAMSDLAPTRPGSAGAVAGLFAGSAAAVAYAFSCVETQAPFLAVWYVLGMLVPTAAGALTGPRLLRW